MVLFVSLCETSNEYTFLLCFIIILSGVRLSQLGSAATIGLLYQPQMMVTVEQTGGMKTGRGNGRTRRKPAPVPLCPPQIPQDLTRALTRAAAVGSQRLTRLSYDTAPVPTYVPTSVS
jgi:hypothetical protein